MGSLGDTCKFVYQPSGYGVRLAYYGEAATSEFWDTIWNELEKDDTYARSERGHLPHQFRRTFLKWVKLGTRVREAGCELGSFTVAPNALGYRAEGVDIAPMVIERLQRQLPHMHFFQGDVRCLSTVTDESYDAAGATDNSHSWSTRFDAADESLGACVHLGGAQGWSGKRGRTDQILWPFQARSAQ